MALLVATEAIEAFHQLVMQLPLSTRKLAQPAIQKVQAALGDKSGDFFSTRQSAGREVLTVTVDKRKLELSYEEIAQLVRVSSQTVRNRLTRGRGAATFEVIEKSELPKRGYSTEFEEVKTLVHVQRKELNVEQTKDGPTLLRHAHWVRENIP